MTPLTPTGLVAGERSITPAQMQAQARAQEALAQAQIRKALLKVQKPDTYVLQRYPRGNVIYPLLGHTPYSATAPPRNATNMRNINKSS